MKSVVFFCLVHLLQSLSLFACPYRPTAHLLSTHLLRFNENRFVENSILLQKYQSNRGNVKLINSRVLCFTEERCRNCTFSNNTSQSCTRTALLIFTNNLTFSLKIKVYQKLANTRHPLKRSHFFYFRVLSSAKRLSILLKILGKEHCSKASSAHLSAVRSVQALSAFALRHLSLLCCSFPYGCSDPMFIYLPCGASVHP